jgi:hypothetical protein
MSNNCKVRAFLRFVKSIFFPSKIQSEHVHFQSCNLIYDHEAGEFVLFGILKQRIKARIKRLECDCGSSSLELCGLKET